ncbi:MAG: hypothetical protein RR370_01850 [Synergistaceae bacterium]
MYIIEDLLIDRALRGTMTDKGTGEVIFTIDQVKDPSLECSGETVYSTDAVGSKIAAFNRSKDATLSGANAIINFGMMAAQLGSDKTLATADKKITVPKFQIIQPVESGGVKKLNLKKVPVGAAGAEIKYIYALHNGRSIAKKYEVGATGATQFTVNAASKTIILPTSAEITEKTYFGVWYNYEADGSAGNGAVEISNRADAFAKGGVFDLEVLFVNPCNPNEKIYGHILFGNAKMQDNLTLNISNEAEHGFTVECMQDYCNPDRQLFTMIIPEAE